MKRILHGRLNGPGIVFVSSKGLTIDFQGDLLTIEVDMESLQNKVKKIK